MGIRLYSWSHCCGEWMFFGHFKAISEIKSLINDRGYDPRFFKTEDELN